MSNFNLLKSQKNQLLEAIKSVDLDPFNFVWSNDESIHDDIVIPVLKYGDGSFYFKFDTDGIDEHYAIYTPGSDLVEEESSTRTWVEQLSCFKQWLQNLKREIEEPDLWAELQKYKIQGESGSFTDLANEPFTAYEAEQINIALIEVRSYLNKFVKGDAQKENFVEEKINYLIDAAKRQGRRDWLHTSIGVIVTITTALVLAPEEANNIWNVLKTALGSIFQLPG